MSYLDITPEAENPALVLESTGPSRKAQFENLSTATYERVIPKYSLGEEVIFMSASGVVKGKIIEVVMEERYDNTNLPTLTRVNITVRYNIWTYVDSRVQGSEYLRINGEVFYGVEEENVFHTIQEVQAYVASQGF